MLLTWVAALTKLPPRPESPCCPCPEESVQPVRVLAPGAGPRRCPPRPVGKLHQGQPREKDNLFKLCLKGGL